MAVTRVLDFESARVSELADEAGRAGSGRREQLQAAHRLIADRVRPVYAVDDLQPASRTLRRGRGSCSQRLAVLEAVARSLGVSTRVRGIVVDGRFWYPRFPRLRRVVPDEVVLAWPEFGLDGRWLPVSELFGPLGELAACSSGFTNTGGETLFEAIGRTAVDWDGTTAATSPSGCDLSANVLRDLGWFDDRIELFARHGQTMCGPIRFVSDPFLSRWAPRGA